MNSLASNIAPSLPRAMAQSNSPGRSTFTGKIPIAAPEYATGNPA
jgi:hypothetical protein